MEFFFAFGRMQNAYHIFWDSQCWNNSKKKVVRIAFKVGSDVWYIIGCFIALCIEFFLCKLISFAIDVFLCFCCKFILWELFVNFCAWFCVTTKIKDCARAVGAWRRHDKVTAFLKTVRTPPACQFFFEFFFCNLGQGPPPPARRAAGGQDLPPETSNSLKFGVTIYVVCGSVVNNLWCVLWNGKWNM